MASKKCQKGAILQNIEDQTTFGKPHQEGGYFHTPVTIPKDHFTSQL
jgi:hypothetical protein